MSGRKAAATTPVKLLQAKIESFDISPLNSPLMLNLKTRRQSPS
jgi:hypothetical protein